MAKKLKVEDIPEGFNYAAVDSDGWAYAYVEKPELLEDSFHGDYDPSKKSYYIGMGYDTTDWQNSLVSRETAERPQFKKLTAADIPEGYNYVVITPVGTAIATDIAPKCRDYGWDFSKGEFKIIEYGFDFSDWQNSLVSRENQETFKFPLLSVEELMKVVQEFQEHKSLSIEYMKSEPETAYKETANKLSYSEIDPYFLEQMARRMQKGKEKYGPNNWKKLSDINELLDAAQRHLLELRKMVEEDFEPLPGQESEAQHCAALACNAMFIHYHLNPNS